MSPMTHLFRLGECVFQDLGWAKQRGFTNNRQLKVNPPKRDSLNNKTGFLPTNRQFKQQNRGFTNSWQLKQQNRGFANQQTVYQPIDSLNNKTGILPTNRLRKQQNKGFTNNRQLKQQNRDFTNQQTA